MMRSRCRPLLLVLALWAGAPAHAHEGHDHGDAAPALPATYEPRFEARAGEVEIVGILKGEAVWLYVNRYSDNTPWSGLTLEIEQGDKSVAAEPAGEGVYRVAAGSLAATGKHAVVLTAQGGEVDELLTAELVVPEDETAQTTLEIPRWGWAAGIVGLGALGWVAMRRRR
jgi:hypothetical protein